MCLFQHFMEYLLTDMWLVVPCNLVCEAVDAVLQPYTPVKLQSQTADHFFLPEIGSGQPARSHASYVAPRFQ